MIPVIDLFAGPGGLGEGFSSVKDSIGEPVFRIRLSVEKDPYAHETLELRSFFRQFPYGEVPEDYYRYIRGDGITREELFAKYEQQANVAKKEAWNFELAEKHAEEIDLRIKEALNGEETWVLIGGPPCQAYSVVGRVRMRGQHPEKYENDPRHYLYREYLRILSTHRPPVFVMENVPGLMSSQANGESTFGKILNDLSLDHDGVSEYKLYSLKRQTRKNRHGDFVIHSEKHGVPQRRHRLILIGVRGDLNNEPELIEAHEKMISVLDAIGDLPKIRSGLSKGMDTYTEWCRVIRNFVTKMSQLDSVGEDIRREFEAVRVKMGNLSLGGEFVSANGNGRTSEWLKEHNWWFKDEHLQGYCNHSARFHMRNDICRYLYASCFAKARKVSPRLNDFPEDLRPAHRNVAKALTGSRLFSDRFRVQLADSPAATVVSHISKDGHYFIHPDPIQCRSLTVREAARLQTFPDNYFFCGSRSKQYAQVGNAVPPLLALQIARIVYDLLEEVG
jgi:DNA (cytosine-5)-methyltransferase 1